jgi:hypothetical protein
MADRKTWTKAQLHDFKQHPASPQRVRETFLWAERSILYRLGGNYACGGPTVLAINGRPFVWEERSTENRVLFSLDLLDSASNGVLEIRQNSVEVNPTRVWDLSISAGASHLQVWLAQRRPGLELRFYRVTLEQLAGWFERDTQSCLEAFDKVPNSDDDTMKDYRLSIRKDFENDLRSKCQRDIQRIEGLCMDSDGTVPLIDISRMKLFAPAGYVEASANGVVVANKVVSFSSVRLFNCGFNFGISASGVSLTG